MTPEQAIQVINEKVAAIQKAIAYDMPRIVGKHAVDFYRQSFDKQGFTDEGLEKWQPAKRTLDAKSTDQAYKTLLSRRKELYNSIHFIPGAGKVNIVSDKPYAQIQNEGGTIQIPVTAKMKKYAWAQHYKEVGSQSKEFTPWKGLALTKKKSLRVVIPKRQFMGKSETFNAFIGNELRNYVDQLFKR